MPMTEGEKIALLREHERTLESQGEQIRSLLERVKKLEELVKSPIRQAIHVARQKP